MKPVAKLAIIALLLLAIPAPILNSQTLPDTQPTSTTWPQLLIPAQMPQLNERLIGRTYANRLQEVQRHPPKDPRPDTPIFGLRVTDVFSTSTSSLGINPDDIITQIDGHTLYRQADFTTRRTANVQTISVWSSKTGPRQLTIQPGPIGVMADPHWRADLDYLSQLTPGQEPDPLILAAAQCREKRRSLEETLLSKAQQANNQSGMFYLLASELAFQNGHLRQSLAFGAQAAKSCSPADLPLLATWLYVDALATGRLLLAAQLEQQFPYLLDSNPSRLQMLNDLAQSIPATPDGITNLSAELFDKLPGITDATRHAQDASPNKGEGSDYFADQVRGARSCHFELPTATYNLYVLGPSSQNLDCSFTCHFVPTDSNQSEYIKYIKAGLTPNGLTTPIMALSIHEDGQGVVEVDGLPAYNLNLHDQTSLNKMFKVRITAVGHAAQIQFNDQSVFCGPISSNQQPTQLCFFFQAVGTKGDLTNFSWRITPNQTPTTRP
jgi:hypothetical protein